MAGLHHQRHNKGIQRGKRTHKHCHYDELQRTAENECRHKGRIKKAEPHGMHINPIRKRYKPKSCENRNRVRKRFLKSLPCPAFPFLLQSYSPLPT